MTHRTVIQYVLLAMTWGASFLFIKIALQGLSPAQVVLGRLVSGAVVLVIVCALTRSVLPRRLIVWLHLLVVAVLLCVAPFLLFAWAEQHISSGLASITNATTPLMTMLVSLIALPSERPTPTRLAGLLIGFTGVVVVLGPWGGIGGWEAGAQVACLGATACYGVAITYLRRFVTPLRLPAISVATVQVGLAAVLMLLLTPLIALTPVRLDPPVLVSILALGIFGTGLAYVWNTNVIAGWGATPGSTVTYLAPVVGVALGVAVLGERISWHEPVGAVIVVLGILLTQRRLAPALRRDRPVAE